MASSAASAVTVRSFLTAASYSAAAVRASRAMVSARRALPACGDTSVSGTRPGENAGETGLGSTATRTSGDFGRPLFWIASVRGEGLGSAAAMFLLLLLVECRCHAALHHLVHV